MTAEDLRRVEHGLDTARQPPPCRGGQRLAPKLPADTADMPHESGRRGALSVGWAGGHAAPRRTRSRAQRPRCERMSVARGGERAAVMLANAHHTAMLNDPPSLARRRARSDRRSQDSGAGRAAAPREPCRARRLSRRHGGAGFRSHHQPHRRNLRRGRGGLWDLATDMEPEDGCLWIYGIGDEQTIAFTPIGSQRAARTHRSCR